MFKPNFVIAPELATVLMRLEALKFEINGLPLTPGMLASLRESARLTSTHYSTQIEGNRLSNNEVAQVIQQDKRIPNRERDEKEVLGYYAALTMVEQASTAANPITELTIQKLHALVMSGGKATAKPSAYRDGQNAIYNGLTGQIVYLPPEAKDVPTLMKDLVDWLIQSDQNSMPCPLRAANAHYQFATIHPYYDGNGRTARLLTTLILHRGGFDLKGIYSLDEYYAKNLDAYYQAITVGPSHNYYEGRAEATITEWVTYFCLGMIESFEAVKRHALAAQAQGLPDESEKLRDLSAQQRAALSLFKKKRRISSHDIQAHFNIQPSTARALCQRWVEENFLVITNPSRKARMYSLTPELDKLLFG